MGRHWLFMFRPVQFLSLVFGAILLTAFSVRAHEAMGGGMLSPMCGAMGWGGMILGGILIISIIAVLIALTLYLVRKSRS